MTVRLIGWKTVVGLACALALVAPSAALGQMSPDTRQIAREGFGDMRNNYAWSMAWFRGKLYVGTSRSGVCVQRATIDFYYPDAHWYVPDPTWGCPADKYDMDLRAEIWQFTPATSTWRRVYQSPQIPNPRAPGRLIARYMGFRGMAVHKDAGGKPALYAGAVTPDEYIPELVDDNPPRLVRTTDGARFTTVAGAPGTIDSAFGRVKPIGTRAVVSVGRRLFVTATNGSTGDGVVMEVKNPSSPSASWVQVSPSTMAVFELEAFDGDLYAGTGDMDRGYGVFRGVLRRGGVSFTPIVTGGAGRPEITSVVSMQPYRRRLYVGANGWSFALLPQSEMIRIDSAGHWDLVAGNARTLPDGTTKAPLSGFPDGFGNLFNGHFWRMEEHDGALFLGTNDWSWHLRLVPLLSDWLRPEFGFDLYGTCDGTFWWRQTRDAFGDGLYNFGARTIESTRAGAFLGTTNDIQGASVFQSTARTWCAPSRTGRASAAAAPRRLLADVQRGGTVLSWQRTGPGVRYRVLRAEYRVLRDVPVPGSPALQDTFVPEQTTIPDEPATADLPAAGGYRRIGTTGRSWMVDRSARPGTRYLYVVEPVGSRARSNVAMVPSARPPVTFAEADAALRRLAPARAAALRARLAAARRSWRRGDRAGTLARVGAIADAGPVAHAAAAAGGQTADEDARDVLLRLERRLRYAGVAG